MGTLNGYLNESNPKKAAFEDQRASLQSTLKNLRDYIKLMSDLLFDILDETEYEIAAKDIENDELDPEERENEAANLKNMFDLLSAHLQAEAEKKPPLLALRSNLTPSSNSNPKTYAFPAGREI